MRDRAIVVAALLAGCAIPGAAQSRSDPALAAVVARMGAYVAAYGEKASLIVAVERYTQSVIFEGFPAPSQPRRLVAEFAIVRATGTAGWIGFRDVVEVDGRTVTDRRDRLVSLFTDPAGDSNEIARIANESARFNVGPIVRNFNVPTTALFFFMPDNLPRFQFTRTGTRTIDGVNTWEIAFRETRSPTFVMTRSGKDVPVDGTLWVSPDDGTVVRTRMRMRQFADQTVWVQSEQPAQQRPRESVNPESATPAPTQTFGSKAIDSSADVEVTYRRHAELAIWLPSVMDETYNGPISVARTPSVGRARTHATYSDFRQFATSGRIVLPK